VDFRRAGTAFAGLAIPAAREVVGLRRLDFVDGVEHDHAFGNFRWVIHELSAAGVTAPDSERGRIHFISSMICFNSAGISGIGSRRTFIVPSAFLRTTMFTLPKPTSLFGKSSRKCPPRLSLRSMAERVMASETVSRFFKSSAVFQPGLYSRWPWTPTCF